MSPNALTTPQAIVPSPKANAIAMPQPGKPKLLNHTTHFKPGKGTVTHNFAHGGSKSFEFHDPQKMAAHLKRAVNKEWMHPENNIANPVNADINDEPNE
jgi:hypothetical protein